MLRIETWSLSKIADAVGGTLVGEDRHVCAVSSDTRTITDGALFVPLVGERFDGHDFLGVATDAGAAAIFASRDVDVSISVIRVDDTLRALQRLGSALWHEATRDGLLSIALTGSNGKTTTKELISTLWRGLVGPDALHATVGNLNNHIGVPLTLCALPIDVEVAVIEMGANHFGDIDELIRLAPATIRVVTSIGAAHLEFLGDLDGVRRVKGEIFGHAADADTVAIAPSHELDRLLPDAWPGRAVSFGNDGDITFSATRCEGGQDVEIRGAGFELNLKLGLPGTHNASNLAAALATLVAAGHELDAGVLQASLEGFALPGGRLRRLDVGRFHFVDDAYNANPTSVRASFEAFQEIDASGDDVDRERVAVVGEMKEIGTNADGIHADLAADLARQAAGERFIFVGPYAEGMASAAVEAGGKAEAAHDVQAAADLLDASPGELLVWLKGSRGASLERIIDHVNSGA